jgi:hypothetical protein
MEDPERSGQNVGVQPRNFTGFQSKVLAQSDLMGWTLWGVLPLNVTHFVLFGYF